MYMANGDLFSVSVSYKTYIHLIRGEYYNENYFHHNLYYINNRKS